MDKKTQKVISQAGWKNWDHSCPRFPHWEGAFYWGCSWHPRNVLHSLLYISFCKEIGRNNPKPGVQHTARSGRRKSFLAQLCHSETWVRPPHWGSGDFSTPLKGISCFLSLTVSKEDFKNWKANKRTFSRSQITRWEGSGAMALLDMFQKYWSAWRHQGNMT